MVMWKDFVLSCRTSVGLIVLLGLISRADADLITHWKLDEGDGDVFEDSAEGFSKALYGQLGSHWTAITWLAALALLAPLIVAAFFPETSGRTLEEISPER